MAGRSVTKFATSAFVVEIDKADVESLLERAMVATSGGSLYRFLDGPGQEYVHEEIGLRFAYEGDRKSGNWAPLTDATNDIRKALGFPPVTPINIRTGQLERYVEETDALRGGVDWAELTIPDETSDPTLRQKLQTAQQGSSNNPLGYGPTPPRPVLAVDEQDLFEVMDRLAAWIIYQIGGAVF